MRIKWFWQKQFCRLFSIWIVILSESNHWIQSADGVWPAGRTHRRYGWMTEKVGQLKRFVLYSERLIPNEFEKVWIRKVWNSNRTPIDSQSVWSQPDRSPNQPTGLNPGACSEISIPDWNRFIGSTRLATFVCGEEDWDKMRLKIEFQLREGRRSWRKSLHWKVSSGWLNPLDPSGLRDGSPVYRARMLTESLSTALQCPVCRLATVIQ